MQDILVLQWAYSPPGYFEVPVTISRDAYQMTIHNGIIDVRMTSDTYDSNPQIRDVIQDALEDRFRGVELLTRKAYELSYNSMTRVHDNGQREFFLSVHEGTVHTDSVDVITSDKNGNIVYDSHKERLQKTMELADLAEKHGMSDGLAKSLLASHHAAVTHPDNELVHLYEIREALAKEFGGEKQACGELGISSTKWSLLGRLADNEPIRQGRHRGKFARALRDATEEELKDARAISQTLIFAYLHYVDKHHCP
jgi:hypothetical protein